MEHPSKQPDPAATFARDQAEAANRDDVAWSLTVATNRANVRDVNAQANRNDAWANVLNGVAAVMWLAVTAGVVFVLVQAIAFLVGLFR